MNWAQDQADIARERSRQERFLIAHLAGLLPFPCYRKIMLRSVERIGDIDQRL